MESRGGFSAFRRLDVRHFDGNTVSDISLMCKPSVQVHVFGNRRINAVSIAVFKIETEDFGIQREKTAYYEKKA